MEDTALSVGTVDKAQDALVHSPMQLQQFPSHLESKSPDKVTNELESLPGEIECLTPYHTLLPQTDVFLPNALPSLDGTHTPPPATLSCTCGSVTSSIIKLQYLWIHSNKIHSQLYNVKYV